MNKLLIPLTVVIIGLAVVLTVHGIRTSFQHPSERLSYPYLCKDCGAVFDVQELKGKFQSPKGAPADTVGTCLKCGKGWIYPVTSCDGCGTEHVLYLVKDSRCPKCFPKAAEAAKKAGVDTVFKRPD
jgi:hypothetical protein